MLPFLMVTLIPALALLGIAYVLRPKADAPKVPNQKFQSHIYVSSTWAPAKKIEPYKRAVREDPVKTHPIFDEMESFIRASEARLEAACKASKILFELGQKAKVRYQLVA